MIASDKTRFLEILPTLTLTQLRYVTERPRHNNNADAARALGLAEDTPSRWPNRDVVAEAVRLVMVDGLLISQEILRRDLPRAALVKVKGLTSGDERIQQAAATEILDRFHGRPKQSIDATVSGPLAVTLTWGDGEQDATASDAP